MRVVGPGDSPGHDESVEITAEFTIEPFADGAPGPHVRAAIEVAEAAGLAVDVLSLIHI